jgi:hydrogenase maturation protease
MRTRVVGIGQPARGDASVALAVVEALRQAGLPADVEVQTAAGGADLVPLLLTPAQVLVVDAVVGDAPGTLLTHPEALAVCPSATRLSDQAIGVREALAFARAIDPARVTPRLRVVGVVIAPPAGLRTGLDAGLAAAIPWIVERLQAMVNAPLDAAPPPAVAGH